VVSEKPPSELVDELLDPVEAGPVDPELADRPGAAWATAAAKITDAPTPAAAASRVIRPTRRRPSSRALASLIPSSVARMSETDVRAVQSFGKT
jgi:hypothetical protein